MRIPKNNYDPVPRITLLTTCVAACLGCATGIAYFLLGGEFSRMEQFTVPIVAASSAAAFVILMSTGNKYFDRVGKAMLFLWGIYLAANIANQMILNPGDILSTLVFAAWLPGFHMLAFVVLDKRSAQFICWWIIAVVILMYGSMYSSLPATAFSSDRAVSASLILLAIQPCIVVMLSAIIAYRVKLEVAGMNLISSEEATRDLQQTLETTRAAQKEAHVARELLTNTINSINSGVVVFDKDGRQVLANTALKRATEGLGIPMDTGISWSELARLVAKSGARNSNQNDTSDDWLNTVTDLHRNGGGASQFSLPDGRSFLGYERFWEDGTSVTTLTNVTELEQNKETIAQLHKMEALGRLTGGIAHDFNNLLSIIVGNLEFMQDQLREDHVAHDLLDQTLAQTEKGASLIQQLLAFVQGNKLKLTQIDAAELVSNMIPVLESAVGRHISIEFRDSGLTGDIRVEPDLLQSMILNIALNARDAMSEGGELSIEISQISAEQYPDLKSQTGEIVEISFTDTGQGIPTESINRVFEPFYTTKTPDKGSGLGLSMVYGLCKQFEGDVKIESEPGSGTTVTLLFPLLETKSDAAVKDQAPGKISAEFHGNLLLIEDNDALREVSNLRLTKLGFNVTQAESAEKAMSLFDAGEFAVVFSDVVLPDGNGYVLANKMSEADPKVAILLTSGYTDLHNDSESVGKKNFPFLAKPHSIHQLIDALRSITTANL